MALFKVKPVCKEAIDLVIKNPTTGSAKKQGVHLINVLYTNGYYDCIILLSTPNHRIARRYYESVRITYKDYVREESLLFDVNFSMV